MQTKEAIGLFCVTEMGFIGGTGRGRSAHMSHWSAEGDAIVIANLNGKAIERINVERDVSSGKVANLMLDRSATLGLGKGMSIATEATYFGGNNAFGRALIGGVTRDYDNTDIGDMLTATNSCKEDGCEGATTAAVGHPNNIPICPAPSTSGLVYITLAGGGALIADSMTTPMSIVGAHGNSVIYGAGCGGIQTGDKVRRPSITHS